MKNENQLLECAQNGDANAMWKLGNMYYFPKCDFEKALYWYNQALENGNNDAIISIARVYEQIDIQKAAKDMPNDLSEIEYELSEDTILWYQKALDFYENHCLDKVEYACLAGDLLSDEDAIEVDFKRAFAYYQFAANIDSDDELEKFFISKSQCRLAKMYELGLGCKKDLILSKHYREKAKIDDYRYQQIEFHK